MAKLILKAFRCLKQNDNFFSDSPYFVILIANSGTPAFFDVKRLRDPKWDNNFEASTRVDPNMTVSSSVGTNSLVLVALMEEEDNPDIGGTAINDIKAQVKPLYDAFWASGAASADDLEAHLAFPFMNAVFKKRGNDDVIQIPRLKITKSAGDLPLLDMKSKSESGEYRVRFAMA